MNWKVCGWISQRDEKRRKWHKKFVIVPVRLISGEDVWLQFVEARLDGYMDDMNGSWPVYSYRSLKK